MTVEVKRNNEHINLYHSNKTFPLPLPTHIGVAVVVGMGAGGVTSVADLLLLHMNLLCRVILQQELVVVTMICSNNMYIN